MKKALAMLVVVGLMAGTANAATLWMQFEGGGNVATLAPSESINVEIWVDLLAGDALSTVYYTNWPYDGAENPGAMDEPNPYPNGVEGLVQTGLTAVAAGWNSQPVNGVLGAVGGDGLQQVAFGTTSNFLGGGSFLIGIQTIHQNEITNALSTDFNGSLEYDFYPIMFGGDPGTPVSALLNSTGGSFTFAPNYAGGYANYYTWGQGSAAANSVYGGTVDNPLMVYCIPEPASLSLLALGALAVIRRR